jgi:hypothetical protein
VVASSARAAAPVIGDKLPPLEEVVARVPPRVLGMMDELFRAKFTGVRRVPALGEAARPSSGARGGPA